MKLHKFSEFIEKCKKTPLPNINNIIDRRVLIRRSGMEPHTFKSERCHPQTVQIAVCINCNGLLTFNKCKLGAGSLAGLEGVSLHTH